MTAAALRRLDLHWQAQSLYRQRLENGRCVLAIEVNEADVTAKLVEVGLLRAEDAENRTAIAAALTQQIELLLRFPT